MLISPPFLPAPDADDEAFVCAAMPDAIDIAPNSGGAPLGSYPLTTALTWHNGLHIDAPRNAQAPVTQSPAAPVPLRLPVRAIADGTVIFKREPKPANTDPADPQNYNPYGSEPAWSDSGIVIVRHTTDIGASGNTPTTVSYYSVYMHLSRIEAAVVEKQPIWRKDAMGTAGRILGREHQIHFEICLNTAELQKLLGAGRPLTWRDPATAPTADGRTDSVFGSVYVYLRAGTPTSAAVPVSHLRGGAVAGTLQEAQWVEIRYRNGTAKVSSYRATEGADGSPVGTPIGQSHSEPDFEYNLYAEANRRHASLGAAVQATSSPSGWYELLRFGRNLGPDPLPGNAAHWRQVPTSGGAVWADLNAPGTFKFSDADFPAFLGWQCYGDDPTSDNQRCDSLDLKRAIRDPKAPESIRQRAVLARRLGDAGVRSTFKRAICKFPTEWDRGTIAQRYEWLKTDDEFRVEPGKGWEEFEAHCKAISFDDLPEEYKAATWHLHPRTFISHMRMCGWLSARELAQCIPRDAIEQTRSATGSVVHPQSTIGWTTALDRANRFLTPLNCTFRKYGISVAKTRLCYFLANSIQETIYLSRTSELGGNGTKYAPWYGRGLLQLTWEINYRNYGDFRGWQSQAASAFRDSLETDVWRAADSAGYYWITCARSGNAAVNISQYADVHPAIQSSKLQNVCTNYSYSSRSCQGSLTSINYYSSLQAEQVARAINTGNANSTGAVNGLIPRNNVLANALNVVMETDEMKIVRQRP